MLVSSHHPILELGLNELIGINDQVDQNDYGGSVAITLGTQPVSGEILAFAFYSTETGSGAVLQPTGKLILFDADPTVVAGDTLLTATDHITVLAVIDVAAGDWVADAGGAVAYIVDTPVAFHAMATLYAVWKHTFATSYNDAAGDDEQLRFNAWYRRDGI
jgi:hypothetical protein